MLVATMPRIAKHQTPIMLFGAAMNHNHNLNKNICLVVKT